MYETWQGTCRWDNECRRAENAQTLKWGTLMLGRRIPGQEKSDPDEPTYVDAAPPDRISPRFQLSPSAGINYLQCPDQRFPIDPPGSTSHPVEPELTSRITSGWCCVDPRNQLLGITS
ncbi:hypothetical protein NITHO_4190003 [Nitrolancea hollandica Lb]|uniref:Uncharacterized protein n=1 Tax=Nitrolancea hollandica Lb TaxID=1129897 RepID=I4EJQ1_9BACT|nr:hypothetical protein NITHO_4190003 [Nitrolancea hollandica Lb]